MRAASLFKLPPIYLASASPRRHEILTLMGVQHQVLRVPAPEGEDEPQLPGESPDIYVRRTAREKAQRATHWLEQLAARNTNPVSAGGLDGPLPTYQQHRPAQDAHAQPGWLLPVLCADTTVILDGDILGKPRSNDEAREMLARLSGRTHAVHTAVVLAHQKTLIEDVSVTHVNFRALTGADIDAYCATGEPAGKAGAYGIQGCGGMFVQSIQGSYTGVMGLPMFETARLLQSLD
ncbi:Maf family protein [Allopusillimonas ginsengisoli]|uniref:Maf family protein n=1 Tax=Allopusillimonas ginsengisoli TaxID=453575 RepID=UPI001020736F|nr:Maf family protein [Allopusillimonas ginsengisoli]TEA78123.1 septum formation protein Maf [Allopusillimonas ginsengisoli]